MAQPQEPVAQSSLAAMAEPRRKPGRPRKEERMIHEPQGDWKPMIPEPNVVELRPQPSQEKPDPTVEVLTALIEQLDEACG